MRIGDVGSGTVTIILNPGECLTLAEVCLVALETVDEVTAASEQYHLLSSYFEALALVADARPRMKGQDEREYNLASIRENWPHLDGRG